MHPSTVFLSSVFALEVTECVIFLLQVYLNKKTNIKYKQYPPHFRLGRAYTRDGAGEYAWKVAAIARVAAARRGAKVSTTCILSNVQRKR